MNRRKRNVGAARKDGDGASGEVDSTSQGAGVDAEVESADNGDVAGGEVSAECAGHLPPVGSRPTGADDRHRLAPVEAEEERGVSEPDQRARGGLQLVQGGRVEGI